MTYITRLTARKAPLSSRIMARAGFVLVLALSSTVHAQWTNGTDISNTNTGNVGIGTTAPTAKLNISSSNSTYSATGNALMRIDNNSATGQSPFDFFINGTLRGRVRSDYAGNLNIVAKGGDHYFWVGGDYGAGTAAMTVKASGNVGIGIISPTSRTHLYINDLATGGMTPPSTPGAKSVQ